ncbi:hypothetical protein EON64_19410, partial [archaeon]
MIGRFGISSNSQAQSGGSSNTPTKALNNVSMKMQSLSSLTSKMKLTDLTKKVSAGLNLPMGMDADKKALQEAEERKAQMSSVLSLLEDVHLQAPATHLGLVLAYNSKTQSPILHPHVKFTWYRMASEERVEEVAESGRGWFAPSLDDVHCKLCVQIEDSFGQGYSRYLEVRIQSATSVCLLCICITYSHSSCSCTHPFTFPYIHIHKHIHTA